MTKHVVFSLGQLVQPKTELTINALAALLRQQGYWFAKVRVQLAGLLDKFWYGTIDAYKSGRISDDVFLNKMCYQLNIIPLDAFWPAWNKMCTLSAADISCSKIILQFALQNVLPHKRETNMIIVSSTNPAQYAYILEKWKDCINKDSQFAQLLKAAGANVGDLAEIMKPYVTTSFGHNTISNAQLARYALGSKVEMGDVVISLHRSITREAMPQKVLNTSFVQMVFSEQKLQNNLGISAS